MIGIDLGQYVHDPYATGIQRVLQQLAVQWPLDVDARWVVPTSADTFLLLEQDAAAALLSLPFTTSTGAALREGVIARLTELATDRQVPQVRLSQLMSLFDGWLLPEVSYLPSVLERLEMFGQAMPVTMIGYDALPMTDPANYRFVPGVGASASEYFRALGKADTVVCISTYARSAILDRLRRSRALRTTVAHPGGDHIPARPKAESPSPSRPQFLRLGTMEARKRPLEILRGFQAAVRGGLSAELVFIGNPNASSQAVNEEVLNAIADGYPVTWIRGATDDQVYDMVAAGHAFLSIGIEGYGIPVLEAIRLGTPVLYDGTQPAAELMNGRGATHVQAANEAELERMFLDYGRVGALDPIASSIDASRVPSWRDFASAVASACVH